MVFARERRKTKRRTKKTRLILSGKTRRSFLGAPSPLFGSLVLLVFWLRAGCVVRALARRAQTRRICFSFCCASRAPKNGCCRCIPPRAANVVATMNDISRLSGGQAASTSGRCWRSAQGRTSFCSARRETSSLLSPAPLVHALLVPQAAATAAALRCARSSAACAACRHADAARAAVRRRRRPCCDTTLT